MTHANPATPGAGNLFDELMRTQNLKNDAALSRALEVQPPVISKMRHGHLPVGDSMILRLHEKFGIAVKTIREWLA
jgi:plasmid maintenance system antidote protein VapI